MTVPGIVEEALDGDRVAARVSLSGGDEAFVADDRTLVYRAGGMLSDESVDSVPHDALRVTVSEGRRKATLTFEYARRADADVSVPLGDLEAFLRPVLAAVVRAGDAIDPDERVLQTFRFSELTLVVTDERLFKHVGAALWDDGHESYHYADVADLDYEEGSVATGIVLTVDGRKERIKAPNDRFPAVRDVLEEALLTHRGIDSVADLSAPDDGDADDGDADDGDADDGDADDEDAHDSVEGDGPDSLVADLEDDIEPLDAGGPDPVPTGSAADASGTTDAGSVDADAADESDGGDGNADDEAASDHDGDAGEDTANSAEDADHGEDADGGDAPDADEEPTTPFTEEFEPADGADTEDADDADGNEATSDDGLDPAVAEELAALRSAVERHNELLAKQHRAIHKLIEHTREN